MEDWELLGPLVWSWAAMLFGLLVTGVVVWLVVRSARRRGDGGKDDGAKSPEAILKERYARGEVDRETYVRMLEDLRR